MVVPSLQSLQNFCGIRIAYLMWTRHELFIRRSKEELFEDFLGVVSAGVESLPLPDKIKSPILDHVELTGKHLLSLLNLWFIKTQHENSQKWLTEEVLIECLVLSGDGMINQRKTAEKILSDRLLHNEIAFRFACINFLEIEIIKLWPSVKNYFLNRIMLGTEMCPDSALLNKKEPYFKCVDNDTHTYWSIRPFYHENRVSLSIHLPGLKKEVCLNPFTTESVEVVFWISHCLSKENSKRMGDIPHFAEVSKTWRTCSLRAAADSGNAACFEYFYRFQDAGIEYNSQNVIQDYFVSLEKDTLQSCFIFHFNLLSNKQKCALFHEYPKQMLSLFLQWPLSLTFVENAEEVWNLIPESHKERIFVKIFAILFHKNAMILPFASAFNRYFVFRQRDVTIGGIHSIRHLEKIWIALWKISSDSYKSLVLNDFVFQSLYSSLEFRLHLGISGVKERLMHVFLTNGEAILEIYKGVNMRNFLDILVAKHVSGKFDDDVLKYILVGRKMSLQVPV